MQPSTDPLSDVAEALLWWRRAESRLQPPLRFDRGSGRDLRAGPDAALAAETGAPAPRRRA